MPQTTFVGGINPFTQEPAGVPTVVPRPVQEKARSYTPKLQRRNEVFNCLKAHPGSTLPQLNVLLPHIRAGIISNIVVTMLCMTPPMVKREGTFRKYRYTTIGEASPATKQQQVLDILKEFPGLSGGDLAEKMGTTAHSMYDIVYALEALREVVAVYQFSERSKRKAKHFYLPDDAPQVE